MAIVGASFTAPKVSTKLSEALRPPASVATTVTVTAPLKLAGGVPVIAPVAASIDSHAGEPVARL